MKEPQAPKVSPILVMAVLIAFMCLLVLIANVGTMTECVAS